MSKYWTCLNKVIEPRDTIFALRKPAGHAPAGNADHNPETHKKNSQCMAELARTYHDSLQNQGRSGRDPVARDQTTKDILETVETEPSQTECQAMNSLITEEEVKLALRLSNNDKAAGLDGTTYEMWKSIAQKIDIDEEDDVPFNDIHLMTAAFNDIEKHGTSTGLSFAEGWMCPIYKKKEQDEIKNY